MTRRDLGTWRELLNSPGDRNVAGCASATVPTEFDIIKFIDVLGAEGEVWIWRKPCREVVAWGWSGTAPTEILSREIERLLR